MSLAAGLGRQMIRAVDKRTGLRAWMKEGAFAVFGVVAGLAHRRARPLSFILSYHSHSRDDRWGVRILDLERQLAFLASRFTLVPLRDLPNHLGGASGPIVCLTFDDGYVDHYELTLPMIERFGARATFFLIPSLLGSRLRTSWGEARLMTREHAQEIASRGHEVGSHTLTHTVLTELSEAGARNEIVESKRSLEGLLGTAVTSFAYPRGRWNQALRTMVGEAGYSLAVTTRRASLRGNPDWLALPRVPVDRNVGHIQFRAQLTGAVDTLNRIRGKR